MISANDVFNDLRKSGKLPSPGGVAMRLIDLASRDDVTAGELSRALQGDPSLAGRVLKVANSASAGSRAVVSIADAVVRIGFRSVRQLAMGFSLIDRCGTGVCENFNYDRFWSRALAAAVAAERLGREVRTIPADECFTLGLMHDVGTLALATAYPIEYSGMLADLATRTAEERMARERDAFGLGNRDITALLLADWHLPKPLIEAVVDRGTVAAGRSDRAQRLADLVQLATHHG
jgi:two-component system cell cycle response regulator